MGTKCYRIRCAIQSLLLRCPCLQHLLEYCVESMVGSWQCFPDRKYSLPGVSDCYGYPDGLRNWLDHPIHQTITRDQPLLSYSVQHVSNCKLAGLVVRTILWGQKWLWRWRWTDISVPIHDCSLQFNVSCRHFPSELFHCMERSSNCIYANHIQLASA